MIDYRIKDCFFQNIVYVENAHENRIGDGNEGENEEGEEEEDTNALQHDILEPSES